MERGEKMRGGKRENREKAGQRKTVFMMKEGKA